ncbi:MAG: ATP synthase F1 subunit epsilon [Prevotellaceae bacterium]|jgi:F-type H+-transporting ATPase subunit epsilon|nr:ATP synthase F1 subunit epsilon [Prevotellaceae bacterium]
MKLEILTPEQQFFRGEVRSVTLPGAMGSFEALENHAPIISALASGVVKYVTAEGAQTVVEVGSGFVEVSNNVVNVCVEEIKR